MPNCTNAPSAIFWLLSAIAACRCAHSIHRPTKRRRRLLKKLRRNARSKTPRSYQRKAARNLVPGRGAHWPARHADPCLGQTRDAPPCAARSALRMGLHFWRRLPAAPHHRSPRRADRQHRSHVHASQRNRGQRRTGRARSPCSRRRWISSRHRPRRTRQHHTCSPAALRTRAQPDRKRLAISARQQALQHDLRKLRRYPRKSLPSMDVLRQRQGAGRFNHHTPMGKGQSLAPLVLYLPRHEGGPHGLAHAPIVALLILSGSLTGSPFLILSTFSMPSITLPQAVYWLSRKWASSKQMKNWLSPESGLAARAIDTVPRTCGSLLNSALSFWPEPPVPVPCGQPVCAMKPSITRWNTMPS